MFNLRGVTKEKKSARNSFMSSGADVNYYAGNIDTDNFDLRLIE